jgi:hypothetical protein
MKLKPEKEFAVGLKGSNNNEKYPDKCYNVDK